MKNITIITAIVCLCIAGCNQNRPIVVDNTPSDSQWQWREVAYSTPERLEDAIDESSGKEADCIRHNVTAQRIWVNGYGIVNGYRIQVDGYRSRAVKRQPIAVDTHKMIGNEKLPIVSDPLYLWRARMLKQDQNWLYDHD